MWRDFKHLFSWTSCSSPVFWNLNLCRSWVEHVVMTCQYEFQKWLLCCNYVIFSANIRTDSSCSARLCVNTLRSALEPVCCNKRLQIFCVCISVTYKKTLSFEVVVTKTPDRMHNRSGQNSEIYAGTQEAEIVFRSVQILWICVLIYDWRMNSNNWTMWANSVICMTW